MLTYRVTHCKLEIMNHRKIRKHKPIGYSSRLFSVSPVVQLGGLFFRKVVTYESFQAVLRNESRGEKTV